MFIVRSFATSALAGLLGIALVCGDAEPAAAQFSVGTNYFTGGPGFIGVNRHSFPGGIYGAPYPVGAPYGYGGGYDPRFGMSSIIRSRGEYNRDTSEAMKNYEQARAQYLENLEYGYDVFNKGRRMRLALEEEERERQRNWLEQSAQALDRRIANERQADRLGPEEYDPRTGKIYWPALLQAELFDDEREAIDEMMVMHAYSGGSSGVEFRAAETLASMQEKLKSIVREVPPPRYISARKFIEGLYIELET